jgi:rubrerythrin
MALIMKRWRCLICGYIHEGETPPYVCPICGAPQKMFEALADDDGSKPA